MKRFLTRTNLVCLLSHFMTHSFVSPNFIAVSFFDRISRITKGWTKFVSVALEKHNFE